MRHLFCCIERIDGRDDSAQMRGGMKGNGVFRNVRAEDG
jgi:hypothetical protein